MSPLTVLYINQMFLQNSEMIMTQLQGSAKDIICFITSVKYLVKLTQSLSYPGYCYLVQLDKDH